jgi:uncharacterized protein with ATP-grasp and redox domains
MNNRPECIACCLRRVLHTAELVTTDEWLHRKLLGEVMQDLSRVDELATPAEVIFSAARRASKTLGVLDPYGEEKRRWIEQATSNADLIRGAVDASADPFAAAVKLSVAANLLDCELREERVRGFSLVSLVEEIDGLPFASDNLEELRQAVARASSILFIHDTAGELFFDRLLIEKMQKHQQAVTSVVREAPILGDATREDAIAVGLDQVARIIDPGIDCLGVPLSAASQSFREEYAAADLVVAKGQAAYETLEGKDSQLGGEPKEIFFLLRVKCPVMARQLGVEIGDCIVEQN